MRRIDDAPPTPTHSTKLWLEYLGGCTHREENDIQMEGR